MNIRSQIERIKSMDTVSLTEGTAQSAMILPMLRALGWDTTDPDEVKLEHSVGKHLKGFADIVLFSAGNPLLLIETKAPAIKLSTTKRQVQALEYCKMLKVPLGILTNGVTWHFFYLDYALTGGGSPLAEVVNLLQDDPDSCERRLRQLLSRDKVSDNGAQTHVKRAWIQRILTTNWETLVVSADSALVKRLRKSIKDSIGISVPVRDIEQFLPTTAISAKSSEYIGSIEPASSITTVDGTTKTHHPRHPKPTHVQVQGQKYKIKTWKEGMSKFLSEAYNSDPSMFHSRLAGVLKLVTATGPDNAKEQGIRSPERIAESNLWVETHGSSSEIRKKCDKVRHQLGWSEGSVVFLDGDQPLE